MDRGDEKDVIRKRSGEEARYRSLLSLFFHEERPRSFHGHRAGRVTGVVADALGVSGGVGGWRRGGVWGVRRCPLHSLAP